MRSFMGSGGASLLVSAKKRFLSQASAALETNSRRNTSCGAIGDGIRLCGVEMGDTDGMQ